ncbi:MAG: peptidoglycan bridge formation glycyltransferase FemA/FemB family protein [Candidatus Portnoybacteria bacterium]|nr:peptidoglycan bridge formation glycyltransferase FemA/FemB family protein [Candidatus Portnoybacteria bacterium]MDD4982683.1 peptidoglycan bridge formation glycyltransferase FemA/FemB family protein [Candidatus Portnoybacteria bacterium]
MDKQTWNKFVLENGGSFLQSWEWGEFQENIGRRVFRFLHCHPEFISGSDSEALKQVQGDKGGWRAQFIANKLPGVNKFYWHCPRGPVLANGDEQMANSQIRKIIDAVKKSADKKVIFFRFGPEWPLDCHSGLDPESRSGSRIECGMTEKDLKNIGFKQLSYDIEPSQTQILDISKTEDELLAQMHEKWRYNIRLAQKKGVQIKFTQSECVNFEYYFEEFYRLVSQGTSERNNIKHHPKEYYRKQLKIGAKSPLTPLYERGEDPPFVKEGEGGFRETLFVAEYEGKVIAANIVVIFGNRATYLHGATSSEHREVMAPHLLQWEQIKYAKAQGCSEYDFWGVVNEHTLDRRGKSWEGFTRFKKGFGGKEANYIGYWDYPFDKKWYSLYRLVQKFRR